MLPLPPGPLQEPWEQVLSGGCREGGPALESLDSLNGELCEDRALDTRAPSPDALEGRRGQPQALPFGDQLCLRLQSLHS